MIVYSKYGVFESSELFSIFEKVLRIPLKTLILDISVGQNQDLINAVNIYRMQRAATRIILLAAGCVPGDSLVASLVRRGVYDIIEDENWPERLKITLEQSPAGYLEAAIWDVLETENGENGPKEKRGILKRIKTVKVKNPDVDDTAAVNSELGSTVVFSPAPPDFASLDESFGCAYYQNVKLLCEADPLPSAILISAGRHDLIQIIKLLRREDKLLSIPVVVVGKCDAAACCAAGAEDCVENLDTKTIERIRARAGKLRELWSRTLRDDLTGLYKRQFLDNYLSEQVRRYSKTRVPFSVMMADLDYFKRINDTHGHQAGDAVLKQFAAFLQAGVRQTDIVARYGGEEFLVVFPGVEDAWIIANKLCGDWAGKEIVLPGSKKIRVTFSAGLAVMGKDALDAEGLVEAADNALYRAKKSGRNRVVAAAPATGNNARVVVALGAEGAFVAANLAASLTWQGRTVCLVDVSPELGAAEIFSSEPLEVQHVRGNPVGAWKKGGRPKELPGLLLIAGTPDDLEDLTETLLADFIIVHAGKSQPKLSGSEGTVIETCREGNNVILKVGPGESEVYIISVGHLSNVLEKARKRRVPIMLLSPEVADAFANLSANMFICEGG
ncbi:diguanylate cyclase [Pelotomaculum terephthalicicum JT]|uniref:GGDEF domain-containing protein n=1 Tax=Pelotomaculum terephthalicicum TaxID=206393 RepID=UPI0009C64D5A|nr:diguanylate cyclase [Pelotomaculum terephthalicicum]MCG9969625.1 diguanylate cyclase [Pelotomaculum terephthalicicum JT]OPX94134.1 MAG: Response regulator PleD [Pelotomaculum sp. PtaB.Bin104]